MRGEPVTDGAGLRMAGLEFEHLEIMLARRLGLAELLGEKIGQRKMRTGFIRGLDKELFQFIHRVADVIRLLQRERKIEPRVHVCRVYGQCLLVCGQRAAQVPRVERREAEVVMRLKKTSVRAHGGKVFGDRLREATSSLFLESAGEESLGLSAIAARRC